MARFSSQEQEFFKSAIDTFQKNPADEMARKRVEKFRELTTSGQFEDPFKEQRRAQVEAKQTEIAKDIVRGGLGVAVGVAEVMNPFSLPRQLEVLGRAGKKVVTGDLPQGETFFERVGKAFDIAEEEAKAPVANIREVAAATRATARSLPEVLSGKSIKESGLAQKFQEELVSQRAFEEGFLAPGSKESGEIGAGMLSLGLLAKDLGPRAARGLLALRSLKNVDLAAVAAKTKVAVSEGIEGLVKRISERGALKASKEADEFRKVTFGSLAPELERALDQRWEKVRALVRGGPESQRLFPDVVALRDHLAQTEALQIETLKELRRAISSNEVTQIETNRLNTIFSTLKKQLTFRGEPLALASREDIRLIDKYKDLIPRGFAPKSKITVSETIKLIDALDDDLDAFYKGKKSSQTLQSLSLLRQELDAGLQDVFPAYKEAKTSFTAYKDISNQIQRRIENVGAESFLANIHGANKTESRELLSALADQGKQTVENFKSLSKQVRLGTAELNKTTRDLVGKLRENAEKIDFASGQSFLNNIADKIVARQFEGLKVMGATDLQADRVHRSIIRFVKEAKGKGIAVGGTIGATFGGIFGPLGAAVGTAVGGKAGGLLGEARALKKAQERFNPERFFDLIQKSKTADLQTKETMARLKEIWEFFGNETVVEMGRFIQRTTNLESEMQRAAALLGLRGLEQ